MERTINGRTLAAVAGLLCLTLWPAASLDAQQDGATDARPVLAATRLEGGTPRIDGDITESAWTRAAVAGAFRQYQPRPGAPASQRTEARVLYDDVAIWVAIRAFDTAPDSVAGQLTRRDSDSYSDWVGVMIDSYFDRRTAFQFSVNPAGVRMDQRWHDDNVEDKSWDPVWDAAVAKDAEGWTAEFRIPLSQLRFRGAREQRWGINFHRNIARLDEIDVWAPTSPADGAVVSRFGILIGINELDDGSRLEILPYAGMRMQDPVSHAAAAVGGTETLAGAGVDLKYGVTSDLTLDVTVNPDFGQVEADPARVNLTAFETLYPERRPFFLESANLFDLRISLSDDEDETETLFYSRRIGRQPHGVESGAAQFAAPVSQTTILGAAKLSGRTAGGWSVGLLSATTAEEKAEATGGSASLPVEPLTSYTVGRLQRDFRDGRTAIGLLGTLVLRERDVARALELHDAAWTAGFDVRHRFSRDRFEAAGFFVASRVRGSEAALARTQRSATHLFQRPDAYHVEFDGGRTAMSGATARLAMRRIAGGPWRGGIGFQMRTPGFEVNDLGYERFADYRIGYAEIGYERASPQGPFRSWELYSTAWTTYTTGGERYERAANLRGEGVFGNLWGAYAGVEHDQGGLSPWALRGGPSLYREAETRAWAGFHTDARRAATGRLEISGAVRPESDSRMFEVAPSLSWRVSEVLSLSGGPFFVHRVEDQQWLGATEGASARYIFGRLDQRTAGLTFRVDHAFTSALTLQLYAQPYVSAGRYPAFRRVLDPKAVTRSDRFAELAVNRHPGGPFEGDLDGDGTPETFDSPEFNYRQFRSNAVLRWEFLPGSTMYLVWSQGRSDLVSDGRFRPGSDLRDLFRGRTDDVLMIKVSYWMSR